jgi:hypothetical protein
MPAWFDDLHSLSGVSSEYLSGCPFSDQLSFNAAQHKGGVLQVVQALVVKSVSQKKMVIGKGGSMVQSLQDEVRCAFFDRNLHSRIQASRLATNDIPLGCSLLLPVDTVNCVQTLNKAIRSLTIALGRPVELELTVTTENKRETAERR